MELNLDEVRASPFAYKPSRGFRIFLGFMRGLALTGIQGVIFFAAFFLNSENLAKLFFSFGVTQFLYILPAIFYYYQRNEKDTALGIGICAVLSFLFDLPILDYIYRLHYITSPCHCE